MPKTRTDLRTRSRTPPHYRYGPFDHERLDVFAVARTALEQGEAIARKLPPYRGHLAEQLSRALLDAYLGVVETAAQTGPPRVAAARAARASAARAAASIELIEQFELATTDEVESTRELLGRLSAMLTRLSQRTTLPR
jgi:hypothetical protein